MDLQERIVRRLEDCLLADRNLDSVGNIPFEHDGKQESAYPYIRASNRSLISALECLPEKLGRPAEELRFLEVGCGIGTKCELARLLGYDSTGIDLLPEYVELAKRVFPDCHFAAANALAYDYAGFDVVYYHVPFFDDELIEQLENRVLTSIHADAVLIATRVSPALNRSLDQNESTLCFIQLDADIGRLSIVTRAIQ